MHSSASATMLPIALPFFIALFVHQANGMVVLAFVINVSVEKFKMRSMCFSFASVLKCASCA